jgi:hypothetical protein
MTTTTVKVKDGVITLPKKLSSALDGAEFLVIEDKGKITVSGPVNASPRSKKEVLDVLDRTLGAWGVGPSGIEYQNEMRKESETRFQHLWK